MEQLKADRQAGRPALGAETSAPGAFTIQVWELEPAPLELEPILLKLEPMPLELEPILLELEPILQMTADNKMQESLTKKMQVFKFHSKLKWFTDDCCNKMQD